MYNSIFTLPKYNYTNKLIESIQRKFTKENYSRARTFHTLKDCKYLIYYVNTLEIKRLEEHDLILITS